VADVTTPQKILLYSARMSDSGILFIRSETSNAGASSLGTHASEPDEETPTFEYSSNEERIANQILGV
jgi:hypothetical protein